MGIKTNRIDFCLIVHLAHIHTVSFSFAFLHFNSTHQTNNVRMYYEQVKVSSEKLKHNKHEKCQRSKSIEWMRMIYVLSTRKEEKSFGKIKNNHHHHNKLGMNWRNALSFSLFLHIDSRICEKIIRRINRNEKFSTLNW